MGDALLAVKDLKKHFPVTGGLFQRRIGSIKAVDGVDLTVEEGQSFGLVGESGSGKTTVGKTILRLIEPTDGEIVFEGRDLCKLSESEMRHLRAEMQMIFQDPYSSLNPRMTVKRIVGEPLLIHKWGKGRALEDRVRELISLVGLMEDHLFRYPHEFSGGQRQRIGVDRALALNPSFIVADEPISALDVSIQAQIINMLEDLQAELGLTFLFIAHDLSVVRHISDRIAVMYLGKIFEIADKDELYKNPLQPYTQSLLSAVPIPDPVVEETRKRIILVGDLPSSANPPVGCNFVTRCPVKMDICEEQEPEFKEFSSDHWVACWRVN